MRPSIASGTWHDGRRIFNRRLADLAGANLNTEEMKRQLERLTREQAELRQQTEELLRRNGDQ